MYYHQVLHLPSYLSPPKVQNIPHLYNLLQFRSHRVHHQSERTWKLRKTTVTLLQKYQETIQMFWNLGVVTTRDLIPLALRHCEGDSSPTPVADQGLDPDLSHEVTANHRQNHENHVAPHSHPTVVGMCSKPFDFTLTYARLLRVCSSFVRSLSIKIPV